MKLSNKAIKEFKEIYYKDFGEKLSDEKARRIAEGFLELFSIVYPYESLLDRNNYDSNDSQNNTE